MSHIPPLRLKDLEHRNSEVYTAQERKNTGGTHANFTLVEVLSLVCSGSGMSAKFLFMEGHVLSFIWWLDSNVMTFLWS